MVFSSTIAGCLCFPSINFPLLARLGDCPVVVRPIDSDAVGFRREYISEAHIFSALVGPERLSYCLCVPLLIPRRWRDPSRNKEEETKPIKLSPVIQSTRNSKGKRPHLFVVTLKKTLIRVKMAELLLLH